MPKFEVITISRSFFSKIVEAENAEEAGEMVKDECCESGDLGEEIELSGSIDTYEVTEIKENEKEQQT